MAKKDFSKINTGNIYSDAIAEATQEAPSASDAPKTRKERKTYTAQEAAEILQSMNTTGRKGVKLPRINLAFAPDVYEYIKTMSMAAGMNYTTFVNMILRQHMEDHADKYQQAIDFRNSL
jgi:predicted DNA binding CopG/RHH family protein